MAWKLRAIGTILIALFSVPKCTAQADNTDALLKTIRNLVNIRSAGAKPFQMEVDFTAQVNDSQTGHLTFKWAAGDLWSQDITMGQYRERDVRKGGYVYISRNLPFTPIRVAELNRLLRVFTWGNPETAPNWTTRRIQTRTVGGINAECIEFHIRHGGTKYDVCFDTTTKQPLSEELNSDEHARMEFADYQPFREHRYPRKLRLLLNGKPVLTADVVSLEDSSTDDATFTPPASAIERRACEESLTPPRGVSTPSPAFPRSVARGTAMATSVLQITVLADGTVTNPQVIRSAGPDVDSSAQRAVRGWKFKPAMCGPEPIATDIQVEVNFDPRF